MEELLLIVSVSVFLYLFLEVIWFTITYEGRKVLSSFRKARIRSRYRDVRVEDDVHRLLLHKNAYYQLLPDALKKRFLIRTALFMNDHSFEGRQGLEVTNEMKVLISAAAVQLTFGLDDFDLRHFDTIILYPDIYLSKATGAMHRGETHVKGVVVLSWKHFEEGIATEDDRLNLGLHELAHALDLSRFVKIADPYFFHYYKKWMMVAAHGPDEVNGNERHFLRAYAGANDHEYFAVCVEHFFEDPEGFARELPELYQHLTILLKQDPLRLRKFNDPTPQWTGNVPAPEQLGHVLTTTVFRPLEGILSILLPAVMLVAVTVAAPGGSWFLIAIGMVLVAGGVLDYFRRAKVFEVYRDFVIIRSGITGHVLCQAAMKNIISIEFNKRKVNDLTITYVEKGTLQRYSYYSRFSREEYDELKRFFHNRDVLMSR